MKIAELKELINLLEEHKLSKLQLKTGEFEVLLEKECAKAHAAPAASVQAALPHASAEAVQPPAAAGHFVSSPMVGTYYECPAVGKSSFVKVGDRVDADTVVCIVEAMKVMNEVKAGRSGIIREVLLENASPVEFGTKLFRME